MRDDPAGVRLVRLWVGAYYNVPKRRLYLMILCVGVYLQFRGGER